MRRSQTELYKDILRELLANGKASSYTLLKHTHLNSQQLKRYILFLYQHRMITDTFEKSKGGANELVTNYHITQKGIAFLKMIE